MTLSSNNFIFCMEDPKPSIESAMISRSQTITPTYKHLWCCLILIVSTCHYYIIKLTVFCIQSKCTKPKKSKRDQGFDSSPPSWWSALVISMHTKRSTHTCHSAITEPRHDHAMTQTRNQYHTSPVLMARLDTRAVLGISGAQNPRCLKS